MKRYIYEVRRQFGTGVVNEYVFPIKYPVSKLSHQEAPYEKDLELGKYVKLSFKDVEFLVKKNKIDLHIINEHEPRNVAWFMFCVCLDFSDIVEEYDDNEHIHAVEASYDNIPNFIYHPSAAFDFSIAVVDNENKLTGGNYSSSLPTHLDINEFNENMKGIVKIV